MALTYPLAAQGVFWTIQGEGALMGEPMAFVRLAGCSIGCPECDTDYRVARRVSAEQLAREVQSVVPDGMPKPWVWLTGGEPTDHDLRPLVDVLSTCGFRVALATAGTRAVTSLGVQWMSVSPHRAAIAQQIGHELKVAPGLNGLSWDDVEELGRLSFPWRFLQPLWGTDQARCIDFVKRHPGWRLGIQAHKYWGVA